MNSADIAEFLITTSNFEILFLNLLKYGELNRTVWHLYTHSSVSIIHRFLPIMRGFCQHWCSETRQWVATIVCQCCRILPEFGTKWRVTENLPILLKILFQFSNQQLISHLKCIEKHISFCIMQFYFGKNIRWSSTTTPPPEPGKMTSRCLEFRGRVRVQSIELKNFCFRIA